MKSGFQRGTGCFKCESCGRQTRLTGAQSVGSRSCEQCYELAGIYNEYQDDGCLSAGAKNDVRSYCEEIVELGGTLDGDALDLLAEATKVQS